MAITMKRRDFIKGAAVATAGAASPACGESKPASASRPHRWIDPDKCVGCGRCTSLCPMGAISLSEKSSIDPDECAECGVCWRSRVCPADAIIPGNLGWPRVLREVFSNPLAEHESTGVPGRGTEGIKTNDSTGRYGPGRIGVFIELGRPALGARFRDADKVTRKFASRGFMVVSDNPVAALVEDEATGALDPSVLDEKAISILVEFILPEDRSGELLEMAEELAREVDTVFNVSVALAAGEKGRSPLGSIFPGVWSLPNGKVNIGFSKDIKAE